MMSYFIGVYFIALFSVIAFTIYQSRFGRYRYSYGEFSLSILLGFIPILNVFFVMLIIYDEIDKNSGFFDKTVPWSKK